MKKLFFVAALIFAVGLHSSFADKIETINQRVVASFHRDFDGAKNVSWQSTYTYYKATFSLGEHVLFAYYSQEGDLIAVVRNILSDHLPILLQADLKKQYKDFWITDLFEMATDQQTTYYCSIESAAQTLILRSNGDGWTVYRKIRKLTI
jgi:hypothetical protein